MNRCAKIFLLWLLALALPMQGYAAVTMSGGMVRQMQQQIHGSALHDSARFMHHAGSNQDVHVGHLMHDMHAAHGEHGADHTHHGSSNQHATSCNTCAVCCMGIAMLPPVLQSQAAVRLARLPFASLAIFYSGPVPASLDRPPRSHQA